jgi:hypothetical protein
MSDYVSGLRQDLVEAAARQQAAGRGARAARPLRPRAWSPVVVLGAVAALAAALVLVVGLRAVSPPRPPEAPKVVGGFHIEVQPRDAVAAGGFVIVTDDGGQLVQIDPQTEEQHQLGTDGEVPLSVAEDGGAVWAMTARIGTSGPHSTVVELDPRTGRRIAAVQLAREGRSLAIGAGGVWLQSDRTRLPDYPGGLERIDRVTHRRTAVITGVDALSMAASKRWLWTREGATVTQRDDRGRVVSRVRLVAPAREAPGQRSIVADEGGAWVVGQGDGLLYRIEDGHVVERLRIGGRGGVIARTRSAVWVTAESNGHYELVRVDPDAGTVTGRVPLGADMPQTIVPVGKQVWVITERGDVVRVNQG